MHIAHLNILGDSSCAGRDPDGHRIASGGADKIVRLWDVRTGDVLREFTGNTGRVYGVAIRPDGRWRDGIFRV